MRAEIFVIHAANFIVHRFTDPLIIISGIFYHSETTKEKVIAGIAGIARSDASSIVLRMLDKLAHRGPADCKVIKTDGVTPPVPHNMVELMRSNLTTFINETIGNSVDHIGVLSSGGLYSSAILALATTLPDIEVHSLTVGLPGEICLPSGRAVSRNKN